MKEITRTDTCERVDDLIGFLYGELSEIEARRFERHLGECGACKSELKAFGQIHESMVEWRNDSLGLGQVPGSATAPMLVPAGAQPQTNDKRSAIAALREFFALSPLWMKGATAFAAVLFCTCAVLAFAYVKDRPPVAPIAKINIPPGYTQADLDARVAQAIEKTRAEIAANQGQIEVVALPTFPKKPLHSQGGSPKSVEVSIRNPRRPFTQKERQELATDLRLVSSKDDDDLDFTSDSNRTAP